MFINKYHVINKYVQWASFNIFAHDLINLLQCNKFETIFTNADKWISHIKLLEKHWAWAVLWLLLILQTSDKTSADEWETGADKWSRVKMSEDELEITADKWSQMRD